MKKPCWLLVLACLAIQFVQAQLLRQRVLSNQPGIRAYSKSHNHLFAFADNPAALAVVSTATIGFNGERKFGLKELAAYEMALVLPAISGVVGCHIAYNGFSEFHSSKSSVGYGRSLGKQIDIGLLFNYDAISIAGYGGANAISAAVGVIMHITEKIHFGFSADNPVGGRFNTPAREKLTSVFNVGLGYDASSKTWIGLSVEKQELEPVNVNAGFSYQFLSQLGVDAGICSATGSSWMAINLVLDQLVLGISASIHPQLGLTPGLMIAWNFSGKRNKNQPD